MQHHFRHAFGRRLLPLLTCIFIATALTAAEPVEGSRAWIDRFIDRSGGCITLANTQPAQKDGTVRNMKCPGCEAEGRLKWSAERPDELDCAACGTLVSERTFPAAGSVAFDGLAFEYHENAAGRPFFIKPEIRYIKSIHAVHRAREMARLAKRNRDPELGRRALAIMLAYSEYYRKYICNVTKKTVYRPGWPLMCNWGRITHFGDYVFPGWFCQIYADLTAAGVEIGEAERAVYRALLEEIISEITLPYIRQAGGMGNPMGAAFADCIRAGRTFPEGRFLDRYFPDAAGQPGVLNGPDLVHEVIEGRHGLNNLLANFWYGDGLMRERSVAYQQMLVRGIRTTAAAIRNYSDPPGYDAAARNFTPFRGFDLLARPVLARMLAEHNSISFPDGRSIPIGDDYGDPVSRNPYHRSSFHPGWGVGALRLGAAERIAGAVLNWGSGLDGHSHNDMLSLLYFGEQMLMLSPPEYPAHRADAIREEWWRGGAAAHNTVVIDGVNHTRSRGKPCLWGESPQLSLVQAFADGAYPGTKHELRRTAMLIDTRPDRTPYLLDIFEVRGGRSHDYFLQAQAPKYGPAETLAVMSPRLKPSGKPDLAALLDSGREAGYAYIGEPAAAPLGHSGELRWHFPVDGHGATLRALPLADGAETLCCGDAPGVRNVKERDQSRTVKKVVRRRTGRQPLQSCFITAFESYRDGREPDLLHLERLPVAGHAVALKVTHGAGSDLVLLRTGPGNFSLRSTATPLFFDGDAALLSLSPAGQLIRATLVGGSRLRFGDREIAGGGTIRGRLSGNPSGLNPDLFAEENAAVTVTPAPPAECAGSLMFIRQANGDISGWKIVEIAPASGGGRIQFDRSARNAMIEVDRPGRNGAAVFNRCTSAIKPGDRVQIGSEWRRVTRINRPESAPPSSMKPVFRFFRLPEELPCLTLDRPVGADALRPGMKLPVAEIGENDAYFIPLTVYRDFTAEAK